MMVVSLQYLRAAASTMVVLLHASAALRQAGYDVDRILDVGNAGVDIFFVISGVVMVWIIAPMERGDLRGFTRSRVLRIVPLWWLATLAAYPLLADDAVRTLGNLARALVFLPMSGGERFNSIYAAGWTLSYEVAFYILVGMSLLLPASRRLPAVTAVIVVASLVGLGIDSPGLASFFTDSIILEFAAGLAVGWAALEVRRRGLRPSPTVLIVVHLAGWLVLFTAGSVARNDMDMRILRWGVPAAVIVATAVLFEMSGRRVPRWRVLEHLGDASYATYLSHLFTVRILGELWARAGLTDSVPAGILYALAVVASVVVGSIVHVVVDRPLRAALARRWAAPTPVGATT